MSRRDYIPLVEKLAAAIGVLFSFSYDDRRSKSAEEILARVSWDHDPIPKAHGGPDKHYNLVPRLRADHVRKTATRDVPMIAKVRRVARRHNEHLARMAAKSGDASGTVEMRATMRAKRKIPSRPFPKVYRPLRRHRRGLTRGWRR